MHGRDDKGPQYGTKSRIARGPAPAAHLNTLSVKVKQEAKTQEPLLLSTYNLVYIVRPIRVLDPLRYTLLMGASRRVTPPGVDARCRQRAAKDEGGA